MIRPVLAIAGIAAAGVAVTAGTASAVPNCGGQNAAPQSVPYTCNLPGIDITAQGQTRHFSAVVFANGVVVTVTYTMSAPLSVPVPIRIVHHDGVSGAGGNEDTSQGFIPAGATTATLVDSSPCRDGQLDVKAVFTANGDARGRVGGPWIQNGTDCLVTTTVPQSSTTTTPTASSTVPPPVSVTTPAPSSPTSAPKTSTAGGGALPATGSGLSLLLLSGVLVGLGALVLGVRRRSA